MTDIDIRALRSHDDFRACAQLQRDTWGQTFGDLVPPSILKVSQRVGGVAAGAFDEEGRLSGFVFGMTGVEPGGRIVHWSDMLAVRPEARNRGLGRRLKEFQRDAVRALGGDVIYWTYDPLVARNAHLNFNVFGVDVVEYVEDMYGDSGSDLHRGIGTDRFVVAWPVDPPDSERLRQAALAAAEQVTAPVLDDVGSTGELPDTFRVEIPADVSTLQEKDMERAIRFRRTTRALLTRALHGGHRVAGVQTAGGRAYYVVGR